MNADTGQPSSKENQAGTLTIEQIAENLAAFAIDRADLKSLMAALPKENDIDLTRLEYETGDP